MSDEARCPVCGRGVETVEALSGLVVRAHWVNDVLCDGAGSIVRSGPRPTPIAAPEPPPVAAEGDVWAEIIEGEQDPALREVYAARRQFGIDKYGTPLQWGNGRNHGNDLEQELCDGIPYARAAGRLATERVLRHLLKHGEDGAAVLLSALEACDEDPTAREPAESLQVGAAAEPAGVRFPLHAYEVKRERGCAFADVTLTVQMHVSEVPELVRIAAVGGGWLRGKP